MKIAVGKKKGVGIWRPLDARSGTDGVLVKWTAVCRK